jgi:hypothetical protein
MQELRSFVLSRPKPSGPVPPAAQAETPCLIEMQQPGAMSDPIGSFNCPSAVSLRAVFTRIGIRFARQCSNPNGYPLLTQRSKSIVLRSTGTICYGQYSSCKENAALERLYRWRVHPPC